MSVLTGLVGMGGWCIIYCMWDYRGPAISKQLYAAIGNYGWAGFDEILANSTAVYIYASKEWAARSGQVKIQITSAIDPAKSPYDVYAKLDSLISPVRTDIVTINP